MTRRTRERKTNRKSRLPRLPVSSVAHKRPGAPDLKGYDDKVTFKSCDKCWKRIEAAYGQTLSDEDKQHIKAIVDAYFHWQQFEPSAPFVADALARIKKIEDAARARLTPVAAEGASPPRRRRAPRASKLKNDQAEEAAEYADDLVRSKMRDDIITDASHIVEPEVSLDDFIIWKRVDDSSRRTDKDLLTSVLAACEAARAQLSEDDQAAFAEGQAWQVMVRKLARWARQKGFAVTASKGASKQASTKPSPSPFVAFVREMQKAFPAERYKRHMWSDDALSTAISDVLAERRKQGANRRKKAGVRVPIKTRNDIGRSAIRDDMAMPLLPDDLWADVESLLPPEPSKPTGGRPRVKDRAALTGILFVLRSGLPWERLPQELGCGSGMTCRRRLRDWKQVGVWDRVLLVLQDRLEQANTIDWSRA